MAHKVTKSIGLYLSITWLMLGSPFANGLNFTTFDFPPFSYQDAQGNVAGPLVEIISLICAEMNEECSFQLAPHRRAKRILSSRDAEAIFPLGWNEARQNQYYFSIPFISTEYGFYIPHKQQNKINTMEDLQDYKVGVFGPSNTSSSLFNLQNEMISKGLKPIKIVVHTDANGEMIQMLAKERFDAYYTNKAVAAYRAQQFKVKEVKYAWLHKSVMYFVGFSKETTNPGWVRRFNQTALTMLETDDTLQVLLQKHHLKAAPISNELLNNRHILH